MPKNTPGSVPANATRLPAGNLGTYSLNLVPRTSLTLAPPDASVSEKLNDPAALQLEIPLKGKCLNFPDKTKCQLYWLVKKGQEEERAEGPLDASIVLDSAETYHLEVNGATPKLDLIQHKVVGEGALGCRVVPTFPHATPATLPAGAITFKVPLGFKLTRPAQMLVGAQVGFKPEFGRAFARAAIRLEILDAADRDSGVPDVAATHDWAPGEHDERTWSIGFTDKSCDLFGHLDANGKPQYAFAWRLKVAPAKDQPAVTLVENTSDFAGIPKPTLAQFGLEFGDHWLQQDIIAHGNIGQLAPGAPIHVSVALLEFGCLQQVPPPRWEDHAVHTAVERDGSFSASLRSRWFGSSARLPARDSVFAILTFPALGSGTGRWPITSVLALDEDRNPGFKDADVVFGHDAQWACSAEIGKLVKTSEQLLDDALVKSVLYCHGTVVPGVHEQLRRILHGDLVAQRGQCDDGVARSLERALIYLGYPTGSIGDYSISGSFGPGANFGWALFLRETTPDQLQDKDGKPIPDDQLIFASGGNDTSKSKAESFPVVPVDKARLQDLLRAIDHTRRTKEVYLASCEQAVDNLDRIEQRAYLNASGVVERFRATIEKIVDDAKTKNVVIKPTWIGAFILKESMGVPRPKYEHHVLYDYYRGKDKKGNPFPGGVVVAGTLQNFRECRFRSTSFGLGQLMGFNFAETGLAHAFDLFKAGEYDQVKMVADHLIAGIHHPTLGPKIKALLAGESASSAEDPGVRAVSEFYNGGGYAAKGYHVQLFARFQEVKAAWGGSS